VGSEPDPIPLWLRTLAGWAWRLLIIVAAVALVFWATSQVRLLFIAVFVALVFTAVLRPLVNLFDKVMWRPLAVVIALLLAIGVFGGLVTYVVASVAGQWSNLAKQFNAGVQQILDFLNKGPFHLNIQTSDVNDWVDRGREWLTQHSGDIASTAFSQAGSVAEVFTGLALAFFCTIFFLARGAEMWTWFLNQMPAAAREPLKDAGGAGWYTFSGYARGTVIIALTDGVLAGIWLTILGVPLAAPLAVLVFIGAFIPLIGAPLAMVVAMIVALATHGVWAAALVGVGIAGIGQLEGHVLQPLVMGRQVSLHPVVVACSVTAGTLIGGLLGAIIAVPLVAVTWAVYSRLHTPDPPMEPAEPLAAVEPPDNANEDPAP
jgi:predicted PurR-regulated permease PerM